MDMIALLKKFIRVERTGNWFLHLDAATEMLPYFCAAGHNHYAKSARLNLQEMKALQSKNPSVYQFFKEGLHPIRTSDRFRGGLHSDLVIERNLMRGMKSTGTKHHTMVFIVYSFPNIY